MSGVNSTSLHLTHDQRWIVDENQCIACLANIIADPSIPQVKKTVAVIDLLSLLNKHKEQMMLSSSVPTALRTSSESLMSDDTLQNLVCCTLHGMNSASDADLQVHLLALMRTLLQDDHTHKFFLCPELENLPLMLTVKRLLLSHQASLQVSVIQCIIYLLQGQQKSRFAASLLGNDVAEFLFEVLHCTDDIVIGSVFCVLLLLTDCDAFFVGCHSVYGIESVLNSLDYMLKIQHKDTMKLGFLLLSKMLERHRTSVRLFGSDSVKLKCLDIIGRGIRAEYSFGSSVVWNSFKHFLRYDLLYPVLPLREIVDIVEQLINRFTTSRDWIKRHSLADDSEIPTYHQKHLHSALIYSGKLNAIILQLSRLVMYCSKESDMNYLVFPSPSGSTTSYSYGEFCHWLVQTVHDVSFPAAQLHSKSTKKSTADSVTLDFLRSLYLLYISIPDKTHFLDADLIRSGLIQILLHMKTSNNSPELNDLFIKLLSIVLEYCVIGTTGNKDDERNNFVTSLQIGLNHIHDKLEDIVIQLQTEAEFISSARTDLWSRILTLLYLVYTAHFHGCRCMEPNFLAALVKTLMKVHDNATHLPKTVVQCATYLLAQAVGESEAFAGTINLSPLAKAIKAYNDVGSWCVTSPSVLCWIFAERSIEAICSREILLFFFSNHFEEEIEKLALKHLSCAKALVNLITSCEDQFVVSRTLSILKAVVNAQNQLMEDCFGEVQTFLQIYLPDMIQLIFLLPDKDFPAENMSVLVEILILVRENSDEAISTQELKLADHAQSILQPVSCLSKEVQVLHDRLIAYLNLLLMKSLCQKDSRVPLLLAGTLNMRSYLTQVINAGESIGHERTFFCVALIQIATLFCSPGAVKHGIILDVGDIRLFNIRNVNPVGVMVRFLLLSTVFAGSMSRSSFVRLENKNQGWADFQTAFEESGPVADLPISVTHLRILHIEMQNCLVKEHEILSAAALCCMKYVFKMVHGNKEIYKHLTSQPWNIFILDFALSQFSDSGNSSPNLTAVGIVNLMVTYNPSLLVAHKAQVVADFFLSLAMTDSLSHFFLMSTVREMILKDLISHDFDLRQRLEERLCEAQTVIVTNYDDLDSFIRLAKSVHLCLQKYNT